MAVKSGSGDDMVLFNILKPLEMLLGEREVELAESLGPSIGKV